MKNKGMKSIVFFIAILFSISLAYAQKIDIEMKDSYSPGEDVSFRVILYDDNNQKIPGSIEYKVQDYYSDIIKEGSSESGEIISFNLPSDTPQKPWKITASSKESEINRLFNIAESKNAKITLEGDTLIIQNTGNVPYEKNILIYIGENDQTASIYLDIGQTKKIRLTAPDSTYDIKVIEGNDEKPIEFKGVSLSGNVVGLESVVGKNAFNKYSIVWIFLITIALAFVVVSVLRFNKKSNIKK